jgi:hypothetical protein
MKDDAYIHGYLSKTAKVKLKLSPESAALYKAFRPGIHLGDEYEEVEPAAKGSVEHHRVYRDPNSTKGS